MKFPAPIDRVLKDPTLLLSPTDRRVARSFVEAILEAVDRAIETHDLAAFDDLHDVLLKLMVAHPHTEEFQVDVVDLMEYVDLEGDAVKMNARHGEHLRWLENYRATIVEQAKDNAA